MPISKKLGFLFIYLFIPMPIIGLYLGGMYNFMSFIVIFMGVPLIDFFFTDNRNPTPDEENILKRDKYFKLITLLYVPTQIALLIFGMMTIHLATLSWVEWLGFTMSMGLVSGGVGINLAHELMHKNDKLQHIASKILLMTVCYGHFFIEHVRGHHVRVATPDDPATARFGESVYRFIPRTLVGSFKSAWRLEKKRLESKGYSLFNLHNQFYYIIIPEILIALGAFMYGGIAVLAYFLLQAFTAIMLLEVVNYIEHYGLLRKTLPNGQYEKVSIKHSWNANHWLSNLLLFHLQRHSDHHANGAKPYQILKTIDDSPQLPSGYLGLYVIAFIPPLWRFIMDKRVKQYEAYQQVNESSCLEAAVE